MLLYFLILQAISLGNNRVLGRDTGFTGRDEAGQVTNRVFGKQKFVLSRLGLQKITGK